MTKVGERIRQHRTQLGLSQAKLAVMADTDPASLNLIENGKRSPTLRTLERVADALDITLAELFAEDTTPTKKAESPLPSGLKGAAAGVSDAERHRLLSYLRAWRIFLFRIVGEWDRKPPRTERDIAVVTHAMNSLVSQGIFDANRYFTASEWFELVTVGEYLTRLNRIAETVGENAAGEERRRIFEVINNRLIA